METKKTELTALSNADLLDINGGSEFTERLVYDLARLLKTLVDSAPPGYPCPGQ